MKSTKRQNTPFALFRNDNNLYQKDIAAFLGVTVGFISAIERGESKLPEEHLQKLLANDKGWNTERLTPSMKEMNASALQKEIRLLQNTIYKYEDELRGLRAENQMLKARIDSFDSLNVSPFDTPDSLKHTIKHLRESMEGWKEIYKVLRTYKPNPEPGFHVGDIIVHRYGFDKTYYSYFLITRLTPAKVEMAPLDRAMAGYIRGLSVPIIGSEDLSEKKLYTRRTFKGEEMVIVDGRYAERWDGLPDSWDNGYCGDDPSDPVHLL